MSRHRRSRIAHTYLPNAVHSETQPTNALRAVRRRVRALRLTRQMNRPINWKALNIVLQWERKLEHVPPDQRAVIFAGMREILRQIQQMHSLLKVATIDPSTRAHVIGQVVKQPLDT